MFFPSARLTLRLHHRHNHATVAGGGMQGYDGDGGQAKTTAAQSRSNLSTTVNASGNIYIANTDIRCVSNTVYMLSDASTATLHGYLIMLLSLVCLPSSLWPQSVPPATVMMMRVLLMTIYIRSIIISNGFILTSDKI